LDQGKADWEARRKELDAKLKFDQDSLTLAGDELERKRRLAAAELIPGDEVRRGEVDLAGQKFALEKEKENLDLAATRAASDELSKQAAVEKAKSEVERAKSRREDDLRSAKVNLETQQRQLERAQDDLSKAFIKAPKPGLVALAEQRYGEGTRPLQEGDLVTTNEEVGQILNLSEMRVHLELPQRVGQMVKKGQRATVQVHGLPGQSFPGKVTQVASFATASRERFGPPSGERSFRTYVRVSGFRPGLLKPGMRTTVRIIVDELKDVVSIPLAGVFTRGLGERERKIVWVREGKDFREVTVKLGQANDESVVVTSGLRPGLRIALRDLQVQSAGPAAEPAVGAGAESAVQQDGGSQ
jgi:RND family efflux transporter MFP subunit